MFEGGGAVLHAVGGAGGWLLGLGAALGVLVALVPGTGAVRVRALLAERKGSPSPGPSPGPDRPRRAVVAVVAWVRAMVDDRLGRAAAARRRAVVELCRVLAAELRAGRDPGAAVESAVAELDPGVRADFAPLGAAARTGHDLAAPLRGLATLRGAGGLVHLAACCRVAAATGAGLADVVDRLADALADEDARRRETSAQLAGPRATALMLSVLPVLGLAMAGALGGSPLAFLFATPAGLACLGAGLLLDAAGLLWTRRLVRGVLATTYGTE
ncbi:type II secretion system F family protein [Streptomonospora sp. S1-112]|uniref:Type II secretion system F family protein n=1 Tax=Streptomonospora mangrovi TaxID=2883123 RepID=A0A9X3NNE0_9ACTN|nr:type II secretion system F family protein [Streptomonospora mangrovi]MDA0566498.1 type II secretion system F family protein [Streptomonospora mangrovi]